MANDVTLSAAAAAGLLSFLSPCVLPLVPPYLTFIAGTTIEDVATEKVGRARRDIFLAALLFVAGFSTELNGLTDDDEQAASWIIRVVLSLMYWPADDAETERQIVQRFVAPAFGPKP